MKLKWTKHTSIFKSPGGTSRGVLHTKDSWILKIQDEFGKIGTGEVSIIEGLSIDTASEIEDQLNALSNSISEEIELSAFDNFPAIKFGLESAFLDLKNGGNQRYFISDFADGLSPIAINGLIWMGNFSEMRQRIIEKLDEGYSCIKIKVGAINFEDELSLIAQIRKEFSADQIEIRVDANGGFTPQNAVERLTALAKYQLHSIEQPIKQGQWEEMAKLCELNILPIALDEELIGVMDQQKRKQLLDAIKPQYVILKPSLLGGFADSDEWISLAAERNIGWWATSALETNIGLDAIAQWVGAKNTVIPQGLGTGQLFTNNFESDLFIQQGQLWKRK